MRGDGTSLLLRVSTLAVLVLGGQTVELVGKLFEERHDGVPISLA